jgi:lipid-A-disaccharide synthase
MGITEVLGRLPRIFSLLRGIKAELKARRPAALIVIDAPDFHFQVIKTAWSLGIPVYYYISPKIWAWRSGRAFFIKKHVRRLLSILPFEAAFYQRYGMNVDYVGNPLVDAVNYPALQDIVPEHGKIGLLPGSRDKEICALLPEFGKAASHILNTKPAVRFYLVRAPGIEENRLLSFWPHTIPVEMIAPEGRYAFMRSCELLLAASGTAVLEAALTGTPTLVAYKVSPLSFAVGKMLIDIPYISLPNLILGRAIFPELLQNACTGHSLAEAVLFWLDSPDVPAGIRKELEELRRIMGEPGATRRAASIILQDMIQEDTSR